MRFGGVDIRQVHRGISVEREIPPGMADRDIETAEGWGGETFAGTFERRGEYTVRVNIVCHDRDEAWAARALLAQWARKGGNATQELEPTHWHGMAYDAICESISPPEFRFGNAVVEIKFCLPHPVAHEMTLRQSTGSGTASMQIGGSEACRPIIKQTLVNDMQTASDPQQEIGGQTGSGSGGRIGARLTFSLDGTAFLSLVGSFSAGDVVEIDMGTGSVMIGTEHAESLIDYTACNWQPGFAPGAHTLTSNDSGTLTVRWHNQWA